MNDRMKTNILYWIFCIGMIFSSYGQMEVMSYNIKYANETDGENSWSKRKNHLTNQVRFYEPDILGVQEALKSQLDHLLSHMSEYTYSGTGRDGEEAGEFSAIFYNTEKFTKLEEGTFWLSETPEKPSKGWDAAYPRVCSYVKLKNKETQKAFWIFNTHFDHVGDMAREKSSQLLLEKINEYNRGEHPVILMGDFNLEPDAKEIQRISSELVDTRNKAEVVFGPEGTFNAYEYDSPVSRRIDYIFISKNDFQVLKYGVLTDSKDLKFPSDHFPVLVKLKIQ